MKVWEAVKVFFGPDRWARVWLMLAFSISCVFIMRLIVKVAFDKGWLK